MLERTASSGTPLNEAETQELLQRLHSREAAPTTADVAEATGLSPEVVEQELNQMRRERALETLKSQTVVENHGDAQTWTNEQIVINRSNQPPFVQVIAIVAFVVIALVVFSSFNKNRDEFEQRRSEIRDEIRSGPPNVAPTLDPRFFSDGSTNRH